ncbi:MAG: hypothetical protein KC733_06480 [Candidatus Omnitrophica bacterium]|nr:hypothetical protein [Candidatus Omnitrophota bacterium]
MQKRRSTVRFFLVLTGVIIWFFIGIVPVWADVYFNILAVNGTDKPKEKDILYHLPKELSADDILETDGLAVEYDVAVGSYFVRGKVELAPKETKTYKIRIRDLWQIDRNEIQEIKKQMDLSISRMENTEYYDYAMEKKGKLEERLNFIVQQQDEFADNVEKRIDRFRTYASELDQIRNQSVSVKYWRAKPDDVDENSLVTYIVEVDNPTDSVIKTTEEHRHYLPVEVKPEHIVESRGFEVRYDANREQSYLVKEEELRPGEKKRYDISIQNVWLIPQVDIDNLKDRTRKVYKLLEKTVYVDSANYLVKSIKQKLDEIEASQAEDKPIQKHISDFRVNSEKFKKAEDDVKALEDLLEAVRENLERSRLKNVLNKIKQLADIKNIAEAIFGTKPTPNTAWKIIAGIVIFVGLYTIIHFMLWAKRSKDVKIENVKDEREEKDKE